MDNNIDIELNKDVHGLIDAVNNFFPGKVTVTFIGQLQSGYVRHDQAQTVQDGKNVIVQIADLSAPNYTASHELLHLLMVLRGFPQVFYSLTTGDDTLDEQLKMMGTELYDIVSHFVVVSEQRKHNLIDDEIEGMYLKGVYATIKPEPKPLDDQMMLRLTTLLDALVFYGEGIDKVADKFKQDFPISFEAAKKLYQVITDKPTDSPFGLRRNVVKLFKASDEQLKEWELPALHNTEFTTLTSVLSERQLGLKVKQLFEIYHSDLVEVNSNTKGYVGFNRVDDQNSFVLANPKGNQDDPAFFKAVYDKSVKQLFDDLKMPYIVRK
ncbi:IpaB/EvcA family protein [Lentilactobacillus parakefiri]|uniref:IpaB/EvcA family protein n=1 Tax=Lentilactobacillus parakefiri TaxID=152332 RepID=UPI000BA70471|nr:IpaB/EvcA family protein [Lentilactobacillus parakefiri]PAL01236.1 IpaB/EvcA family protein [Lentilactobacillus parakefiri]